MPNSKGCDYTAIMPKNCMIIELLAHITRIISVTNENRNLQSDIMCT
jgi:hypothetical protein